VLWSRFVADAITDAIAEAAVVASQTNASVNTRAHLNVSLLLWFYIVYGDS